MEPIFDFLAQTVGWLEGGIAFSGDGHPVAFIDDGEVFAAQDGHYLGHFADGLFRDRLGCIVGFIKGASRSPVLPMPMSAPKSPTVQSRAVPGRAFLPTAPPRLAKPLLNRSSLGWERFVTGCAALEPGKAQL